MLLLRVERGKKVKGFISMPKPKKETQKEAHRSFIDVIKELQKKVRKELEKGKEAAAKVKPKPKPKKKVPDTKRTKDVQRGLKQADTKFKTDREKAEEKRKKKNNPHKKGGGY